MTKYVWTEIFRDKLLGKFELDKNGYVKYPGDITEILDIIEDAIRKERKSKHGIRKAKV